MTRGPVARHWIRTGIDEAAAVRIGKQLGISHRIARLLVRRGVCDEAAARVFLDPQLSQLPDPASMKGVERAVGRIVRAMVRGERIALYGDYDVDGVTSTAVLAQFLRHHGVEPRVYIPKRLVEGYGLNRDAVDDLADEGVGLLITLDCGITAADEIAHAQERGIDTIVVDHHRCPPELPRAYATLNPQQIDCMYPSDVLAAVGVCFNLVVALRRTLRGRGAYAPVRSGIQSAVTPRAGIHAGVRVEPNLRRALDLVALGTIADMVPLTGVNRVLAWYGLQELRYALRPGIRALMEVSRVRPAATKSSDVAFRLAPRVNAAGRLADATVGVRLLLSDTMEEARRLAAALDDANGNRQAIEAHVFQQVLSRIEASGDLPPALVLADPTWHPGVVGIVCSKLVERFDRPVVLIGEGGRGSARTAKNLHLYDALSDCAKYLTKFGGHRAAAGMRIPFERVPSFREAFLCRVRDDPALGQNVQPVLHYDEELFADEVDYGWAEELARLEPFGSGNPEPLFKLSGVRIRTSRVVGQDHLKFRLEEGRLGGLSGIGFKMAERQPELARGTPVDLAAHLERTEWAGLQSLELRVRDLSIPKSLQEGESLE